MRDVFVAPSTAMLVRADLFAVLGGFDPVIAFRGEDLDLSWRAQAVGARVVVAPAARVRHYEATVRGDRVLPDVDTRQTLPPPCTRSTFATDCRAALKDYGLWHQIRVIPQAIVIGIGLVIAGLVTGQRAGARDVLAAFRWNLAHRADGRAARKKLNAVRVLPDGEVRRLQSRGSAALTTFLRGHHLVGDDSTEERLVEAGRTMLATLRPDATALAVLLLAIVLLLGSRDLVAGHIATIGEFAPVRGPGELLGRYISGWSAAGAGGPAAPPVALGLLGVVGFLALGAVSFVQKLVVLLPLIVGIAGAARLGSRASAPPVRARWR